MDHETYFQVIEQKVREVYGIAQRCRAKGLDIEDHVEIPLAKDLPDRVEQLVGPPGIAEVIRSLGWKNREMVAIQAAMEVARRMSDWREKAIDQAIRTGLAILTEGILVAPLEGIAGVYIGKNSDGSEYLGIKFAGPIRSAGGTGQALSVLIGDIVRRELDIGRYVPTEGEVKRYKEEIPMYRRVQHLQYLPTDREIETIVRNCPVCIDGEPTEEEEVSGQRDLPRVGTNRLRGGACLVISEGLALKASKILKHVKSLKIENWDFLEDFVRRGGEGSGIGPSDKFIDAIVVGRPVFSHPSRKGGLRLRYGRARTTGLAAIALNPATMGILNDFLAIGTQLKIERPGKAGAVTSCTSIEGPIVLLKNGDLVSVDTYEAAVEIRDRVREIVDLGEILISFGEFVENNHPLMPGSYSIEWWAAELARRGDMDIVDALDIGRKVGFAEAIRLSKEHGIPLNPRFNLFWHDLTPDEVLRLRRYVLEHGERSARDLVLPHDDEIKEMLVCLGALHTQHDGTIRLSFYAEPLLLCLGLTIEGDIDALRTAESGDVMDLISSLAGVRVKRRAPTRIGCRMGRPEKAAPRLMKPPVHTLFPLGKFGGSRRLVSKASERKEIAVEMGHRICVRCGSRGVMSRCCDERTDVVPPSKTRLDLKEVLTRARERLELYSLPEVKGVQGLISADKIPEPIEKGILRALHGVYVNKDGTVRYEYMDTPITHFRPKEIGTSVEKLHEMGYTHDVNGKPLERDDQIVEIMVQDFIAPRSAGEYLVKVAAFIDDLLIRFYGEPPFYRAKTPEDLIGHLIVGLAPHTSGGIVGRLIGYTLTQCGFAHPYYHAAKRRNCDGDADTLMLLLDGFLNFSRRYLPSTRGGQMDAPLILPIRIDPLEIDKEAHNVDTLWHYPLEFYEAAERFEHPSELVKAMCLVSSRLGGPEAHSGFGYTHDTEDIGLGPKESRYTLLGDMTEKFRAQMDLAKKIRAVDENDVASRIIESHLLRDIMGNLRTFSQQQVRCTSCGVKYRRPPLSGKCIRCDGNLILTVHEGNVRKYIELSKTIVSEFQVPRYVEQRISLLEASTDSLFSGQKREAIRKAVSLEDYL